MEEEVPGRPIVPRFATSLAVAIVFVGILIAGFVASVQDSGTPETVEREAVSDVAGIMAGPGGELVPDDLVLGVSTAPVTIIEYSDFQCAFCQEFHQQVWPNVLAAYIAPGLVQYAHRDFPLDENVEDSLAAAMAARCADERGAFWEYATALYSGQTDYVAIAGDIGLDTEAFAICVNEERYKDAVISDLQDAVAAGIIATPTLVINGQLYEGALTFDELATIIETHAQDAN